MPAFADYVGDPLEPDASIESPDASAAFVRQQMETLYHPVGTCRMGVDDQAVVNPQLRVRGLEA